MPSLLDELVGQFSFEKIDALTKYPNILPLHINGITTENKNQPLPSHPEKVETIATEYISGSLSRIIILDNDFFIGTNDDIIHAQGDRIVNDNIVPPTYQGLHNFITTYTPSNERLLVLYGIAYGEGFTEQERYTRNNVTGFKVIDGFTLQTQDIVKLLENMSVEDINNWREEMKQPLWSIRTLKRFCDHFRLQTPSILYEGTLDQIPIYNTNELMNWTKQFNKSTVLLDNIEDTTSESVINSKQNLNDLFDELEALDEKEKSNDEYEINNTTNYGKIKGLILRDKNHTFMRTIIFDSYLDPQIDVNDIDPLIKIKNDNIDKDSGIEDFIK